MIGLALGWLVIGGVFSLASGRVRAEVYDIVEFHWSRFRARRRLPSARAHALPPATDD